MRNQGFLPVSQSRPQPIRRAGDDRADEFARHRHANNEAGGIADRTRRARRRRRLGARLGLALIERALQRVEAGAHRAFVVRSFGDRRASFAGPSHGEKR